MSTEAEIAWAAGIFEGEGCWGCYPQSRGRLMVIASINMTDEDTVRRFAEIVEVGNVGSRSPYQPNRKPYWRWQVSGQKVVDLGRQFYPWMGIRRRAKIDEIRETYAAHVAQRQGARERCDKGHFIEQRAYGRRCFVCANARQIRWNRGRPKAVIVRADEVAAVVRDNPENL